MASTELVTLPPSVAQLPAPREFRKLLLDRLETEILRVRSERGEVLGPEDTYALIRSLQRFRELMSEYARAMSSVAKVAEQEIGEELRDAVTEHDGVPLSGMTVPDTDGTDIKITLDQPNTHHVDMDTVVPLVASVVVVDGDAMEGVTNMGVAVALSAGAEREAAADELAEFLVNLVAQGITRGLALGSFTPQVTKVRALARELAGRGQDHLAGLVSKSIKTVQEFKGVKINRAESK